MLEPYRDYIQWQTIMLTYFFDLHCGGKGSANLPFHSFILAQVMDQQQDNMVGINKVPHFIKHPQPICISISSQARFNFTGITYKVRKLFQVFKYRFRGDTLKSWIVITV